MLYITGDTHRKFERVAAFCASENTSRSDVLIILGDAGINFFGAKQDRRVKDFLAGLPITLLCVHGNHEKRPNKIFSYERRPFCGGLAYIEPDYPSIAFARDGEIYEICGMKMIAIGGAYSMDKSIRLRNRLNWWADEQPSDAVKRRVEKRLDGAGWKVDAVLSHTCPWRFVPSEVLPSHKISALHSDVSTEKWLGKIEGRLDYQRWYAGHFHINKDGGKIRFLSDEFIEAKKSGWAANGEEALEEEGKSRA
jgi:3-oxoacid CoA-transferase subunit A